jgi:hypothetical protein
LPSAKLLSIAAKPPENASSAFSGAALSRPFLIDFAIYDDGKVRIIFNSTDRPAEIDCQLLGEIESLENGAVGGLIGVLI